MVIFTCFQMNILILLIKSNFIIDVGLTKGYQSSSKDNNKNSIGHLFSKFEVDLDLESFEKSNLDVSLEKVTNDTYLKVFYKFNLYR